MSIVRLATTNTVEKNKKPENITTRYHLIMALNSLKFTQEVSIAVTTPIAMLSQRNGK